MGGGICPACRNYGGQSAHSCPVFKKRDRLCGRGLRNIITLAVTYIRSAITPFLPLILVSRLHESLTLFVFLCVISSRRLARPVPARTAEQSLSSPQARAADILVARVCPKGEILVRRPQNVSPKIIFAPHFAPSSLGLGEAKWRSQS